MTAYRRLTQAEKRDWLRLIRTENVGAVTFLALLDRFGSVSAALEALPDLAKRGGRREGLKPWPMAQADAELEAGAKAGANLVALQEFGYPPALAAVDGPPPLLWVRGSLDLMMKPAIGMVGARNASAAGLKMARDIAAGLAAAGLTVVSGLARGIDGAAHRASLATGTIGVVAGGVDVIYPPEHAGLTAEIAAQGAIVSEMAMGTEPQARHFPRRNRLIAGIARGVVVVEAAVKSGSLITARMAADMGREVFAVPGSPLDPRARGTNDLLRQGATMTESAQDVIDGLGAILKGAGEPPAPPARPPMPPRIDENEVNAARPKVLALLSPTPIGVDELIRATDLTPGVVLTIVLELELAGRLIRHAGHHVSLSV